MFGLSLVTAPTAEPLSLSEAKRHLRVAEAIGADDEYIDALIVAARLYVEEYTSRQLCTATWDLVLDEFPCEGDVILIPKAPLVSVTSITYLAATTGTLTTWTGSYYRVQNTTAPGRIGLAYGQTWPLTYGVIGQVTVRFVAGYGAASAVPKTLKQAMLLLIGHWYTNREEVGKVGGKVEVAAHALMSQHRYGDQMIRYGGAV